MRYERLQNLRYIAVLRCSHPSQADTSIDDQEKEVERFADEHEMVLVDTVKLEGVTGSNPWAHDTYERLLERKETRNDFEVVLTYDISRETRCGADYAGHLRFLFEVAG